MCCVVENAEPDAFWCFTNLMSEIRDNFIKTLDYSECGIGEKLGYFFCYVNFFILIQSSFDSALLL